MNVLAPVATAAWLLQASLASAAELFYQSLRERGIATKLVVYPGMHHGGWPPEFERDYLERIVAWFDKYLQ